MTWYYSENGQQKGPVAEWDFAGYVRNGQIKPETLVWRDGMPDWIPLAKARPDLIAGPEAPVIGGVPVPEQQKDMMVQRMREGINQGAGFQNANPYGLNYAGFWIRVGAYLIDTILLSVVNMALVFLLFGSIFAMFGPDFDEKMKHIDKDPSALMAIVSAELGIAAVSMAIHVIYFSLMVAKWGATLGKMAVGIRVVRADGSPVSTGQAIGRAFAMILNQFACSLTYLMVAFDQPERRGLHDHVCSTRVVYK